ncbi:MULTISPECIES: hypothetical protein [Bacillus cereus group]|uniref:Uncharacterized protein n=1 Tax=Bacillus thuringiensis TaxID=1428 RepID=A0A9X6WGG4_BACTU|nr:MULTISPECIES: hypothetical protein [Bacillus cereus group]PFJ28960.1 hypothetical protein COJ15_32345 [Bacillus thuringiensis]PGP14562.1 hypothetical protein COA01_29820 [Bacillus cereus]
MKKNKKKVVIMFLLAVISLFVLFVIISKTGFKEVHQGTIHLDNPNYICPDGTEEEDITNCK